MERSSYEFLEMFMRKASPSGFESEAQILWKERTGAFSDLVRTDVHGNCIAVLNQQAPTRIMLAGHCDEIGLMVTHIADEGFLHFACIGGIDHGVLPGTQVCFPGGVNGVVGKKPIHMQDGDERKKVAKPRDLCIDIGAKNREEALRYVSIGSPACVVANFMPLLNDLVASKAWDDKVGAFVISEVMRELHSHKEKLNVAVYGVSTVQEEIGSRGARTSGYGIDPHAGIAVDVSFASDVPGDDKKRIGDIRLGGGPILHRGANVNIRLGAMLEQAASRSSIPVQFSAEPCASLTDADVIQISRAGTAAALVSVPTRYIHTPVEVCSLGDIDGTIRLLAETLMSMPANPDFIPY